MQNFVQMRPDGESCLGHFNNDRIDRSFPIYAPLLFVSIDRLLCGDFGLVPAFFGQMPEVQGAQVGMNSYSYSVYPTLPIAAYLWVMCWKHHHPEFPVPWDGGITEDVIRTLGGAANIQRVSQPDYVPPFRPFRLDYNILSVAATGGSSPHWVVGRPPAPDRAQLGRALTDIAQPQTATAGKAPPQGPAYIGRTASTAAATPPLKAPPLTAPPPRAAPLTSPPHKAAHVPAKKPPPPPPRSEDDVPPRQAAGPATRRNAAAKMRSPPLAGQL